MSTRRQKRLMRLKRMKYFAKKLNRNLPRSEQWFQSFWKTQGLEDPADRYNRPWCSYIPDVVNHRWKYVIEIDGSFHTKSSQKKETTKKIYSTDLRITKYTE